MHHRVWLAWFIGKIKHGPLVRETERATFQNTAIASYVSNTV